MIDIASGGQANAETTINFNFRNVLWSELFAIDPVTTGITTLLTFGYKGGYVNVSGTPTVFADGTVLLTASLIWYIGYNSQTNTVVATSTTPNPLHVPLYVVVTGATTITTITDVRSAYLLAKAFHANATQALTTANVAITQAQALCDTITVTGALTAIRDLIVPLIRRRWVVRHTGTAFAMRVIGASGTGITIAIGMTALVECDGTNVVRITADV